MTLNISKAYAPSSGAVANSTNYNTDIAALFNAFSGLEAQTSTLGALTITPSSNSTTIFRVNNAAGTELLSADTTNSALKIKATAKFYLDGGSDTYINESASDIMNLVVGGLTMIKLTEAATDKVEILGSNLEIDATKKFYLDGGSDTYIYESAGNVMKFYTGGSEALSLGSTQNVIMRAAKKFFLDGGVNTYIIESTADIVKIFTNDIERISFNADTGSTGGSASAGSGKQYVELSINGNRYKLLHDGTV